MSSKRKSLIPILLLVMIVCIVGVVYLATFHAEDVQVVVRDLVTRSFGDRVVIEHIQVGLFPYPHLELRDVRIQDPEQGTPVFHAARIQLDLNFLSFIQDVPMPNALIIERAIFDLKRDENGQWNYRNVSQEESSGQVEIGAWLLGRSLKLTNGTVHLEDRYRRESAFIIHAEDVELQVEQLVWDGPTEMFLSARFSEGDTGSVLSAYGTLQDVGGFLKEGTTRGRDASPQFDLHTRMDLHRKTLVQLADLFNVHEVPIGLQGRTKVQGHLHFAPGIEGYDLSVSDLVVLTDSIDLNSEISVKGLWRPEPPTFSGQWSSAPVAIQRLPQFLPEGLIPSELSDAIHRQSISGKIQAVSATFTGSSRKEAGHALTGKFQLSEGRLNLGPKLGTVKEITCTINVGTDEIRFFDLHGQYEEFPVTQGEGMIVFAEQGPWLTTEFGGRVSAQKIIGLMQTTAGWSLPQRPEETLQGKAGSGLLTLRFAGPLKNPQAIAFRSGEYHPERITMQLPGLRTPLTRVEGIFAISENHLRFENVTGLYGDSDFHIQGTIVLEDQSYTDDLRIQGHFSDSDLPTLLSGPVLPTQETISGKSQYLLMVSGQLRTPSVKGRISLQGLEIHLPGILYKPSSLTGNLDFHVRVGKKHQFTFESMALSLPSVRFAGKGTFHYDRTLTFNASLTAKPIRFESLPPNLELFEKTISSGTMEGVVDIRGTGGDWRSWSKSGQVTLTNGVVNVEGVGSPISQVALQVKLAGHAAKLTRFQWNLENSQTQAQGVILAWDSKPNMKLSLTATQFDLDLLLSRDNQRSPLREFLETIAHTVKVSARLRLNRASYHNLKVQNLSGQLNIDKGIIRIDRIRGKADDGTIQGRVLVNLPVQQPAAMKTWFSINSIPLLTLKKALLDKQTLDKQLMTGLITMEGALQGHGRNPLGVLPTLKGTLKLTIKDGRIKRGVVIPKILAIMNLPNMLQGEVDLAKDGYPFDRQTGTFTIANGRVVSKNIVMDGPILKMTAAGQYDLVHDALDVTTAASPLGPYFDLLHKIPLFHLLLEGEDHGLDMAMFSVKGSILDPTVEPLAVESVAFGLTGFAKLAFTVLKNTILLPQKLLPQANVEPGSAENDSKEQESEDLSMESY